MTFLGKFSLPITMLDEYLGGRILSVTLVGSSLYKKYYNDIDIVVVSDLPEQQLRKRAQLMYKALEKILYPNTRVLISVNTYDNILKGGNSSSRDSPKLHLIILAKNTELSEAIRKSWLKNYRTLIGKDLSRVLGLAE
ncbi:hypothetical protein J4526_07450 [Desulfurococcaceae archaeon MEX13E-LK6-19]|nr:hypothetical protein J4526_07450 [Desulfurococcaceae archaeon MEX13E-LK6-19]